MSCCSPTIFRDVSKAMAKSAAAKLRQFKALPIAPDWAQRASACERCPMRTVSSGISYCGKPFLRQIDRDPVSEGCGCPTADKAKSPAEHCPVDARHQLAVQVGDYCSCKWCAVKNSRRDDALMAA
jgi:hypothetical protein